MKKFLVLFLVAALVCPACAVACKELVQFPEHLPSESVKQYSNYFVIRIDEAKGETYRGTLQDVLGAQQFAGQQVEIGFVAGEEAHAICPIRLREGETYLLRSHSSKPPLLISRFNSYTIPKDHEKFAIYVNDLKEAWRAHN